MDTNWSGEILAKSLACNFAHSGATVKEDKILIHWLSFLQPFQKSEAMLLKIADQAEAL